MQDLIEKAVEFPGGSLGADVVEIGNIGAGGERFGARAAKHDTAYLRVGLELCERVGNSAPHRRIERVSFRRIVKNEPASGSALLGQQSPFAHRAYPSKPEYSAPGASSINKVTTPAASRSSPRRPSR